MKKTKTLIILLFSLFIIGCASVPSNKTYESSSFSDISSMKKIILDDFEDLNYWYPIKNLWDSNKILDSSFSCELTNEWTVSGNSSLKCKTSALGDQKRSTFACNTFSHDDFSGAKMFSFLINSNEKTKGYVSIGLQTSENKWYETLPQKISDLNSEYFFEVDGISDISGLFIIFRKTNKNATFYIDDLTLYK